MSEDYQDHLYKHQEYSVGFYASDRPLPKDKRMKPWPYIKKHGGVGLKTYFDYMKFIQILFAKHICENVFEARVS